MSSKGFYEDHRGPGGALRSFPPKDAIDGDVATYWSVPNRLRAREFAIWQYSFAEAKVLEHLSIRFKYGENVEKVTIHGKVDCSNELFSVREDNRLTRKLRRIHSRSIDEAVDFTADELIRFKVEKRKMRAYKCYAIRMETWTEAYVGIKEISFYEGQ